MAEMIILIKIVVGLLGAVFLIAYCIALLMVLLITLVYFCGYVCDAILGNLPHKVCEKLRKKFPQINKHNVFIKISSIVAPQKIYLRYETPLCAFCFSFTTILTIGDVLRWADIKYSIIGGVGIYLLMYFGGMYRKCKVSKNHYNVVLDNNLDFLKLSFVPLTFIVTVVGFGFTITGTKIQDFIDLHNISNFNIIESITRYGAEDSIFANIISLVMCSLAIIILLYIASIPMQLISYFIILIIKYMMKYKDSYCGILNIYVKIVNKVLGRDT